MSLTDNHLKYLSKLDIKKVLKCNVLRLFGPPRLVPSQDKQWHHLPIRPISNGGMSRREPPALPDRCPPGALLTALCSPIGRARGEQHQSCCTAVEGMQPNRASSDACQDRGRREATSGGLIRPPVAENSHFNLLVGFAFVPLPVFVGVVCCDGAQGKKKKLK